MADPMRIRAQLKDGGITEVRVLMAHIMETGQRKGWRGCRDPGAPHQNVTATWNGKTVLSAQLGPSVSQNRC